MLSLLLCGSAKCGTLLLRLLLCLAEGRGRWCDAAECRCLLLLWCLVLLAKDAAASLAKEPALLRLRLRSTKQACPGICAATCIMTNFSCQNCVTQLLADVRGAAFEHRSSTQLARR